ncbi:hypothetical protein ABZ860_32695 [Microbispora sp. NPDC046973]|uniref:hypothetical protein n=1 Tax=Microbispora sp. NPDC046973 TaxID=3155022 RepID=UPI0033EF71A9
MLCTYCGGDTVPGWVVCSLCGAEGSDARPARTATAPPPLRPDRTVDRVVSAALLVGVGVHTAGIAAAPLLRDDWYAVLFVSPLSPLPLAVAAGLLWFTRTAAAGAGIAVAHLVVGFGGRDYAACCFMFNDPSRAYSDWITVGMAIGAVVMTALAGLVANRRLAGGLILGAVSAVMPPLVTSREEGTIPLPGFWIALAAVAAMTALALVLLTRKETDPPSSKPLPGHSPRGLSDRVVAFFLRR